MTEGPTRRRIEAARPKPLRGAGALVLFLGISLPALSLTVAASVAVGVSEIGLTTVYEALVGFDPAEATHQVVRNLRLPRAIVAALVGASLGAAGAVIQGASRNALASPSILGVNAGAAFALAVSFAFFAGASLQTLMFASMAGATAGVVIVHAIGAMAPGGLTPVRLVLAGAAVSAFLGSLTMGLVIHFDVAQDMLFFQAGGVADTRWRHVLALLPWAIGGLAASVLLSPSIAVLGLGEEAAVGLGLRTRRVRTLATVIVVVLAGAAVSVAGPVGFIGLVVPHLVRLLAGVDDRVVIPLSAAFGALLLTAADIGARSLHPTREVPLGLVTALIGVPVFLHLIRRVGRREGR